MQRRGTGTAASEASASRSGRGGAGCRRSLVDARLTPQQTVKQRCAASAWHARPLRQQQQARGHEGAHAARDGARAATAAVAWKRRLDMDTTVRSPAPCVLHWCLMHVPLPPSFGRPPSLRLSRWMSICRCAFRLFQRRTSVRCNVRIATRKKISVQSIHCIVVLVKTISRSRHHKFCPY